jgi:L-fucose mutarotase/ribose pyranase (RbsD/FucU family)
MGHGDKIVWTTRFYPSAASQSATGSILIRCDGGAQTRKCSMHLQFMPLDESIEKPALIMDLQDCDRGKVARRLDEYKAIVKKPTAAGSTASVD